MRYYIVMKEVKFALKKLGVKAKVKIKSMKGPHLAEVIREGKYYVLRIKKGLKGTERRAAIFHECVHIKQYEKNGLFVSNEIQVFNCKVFHMKTKEDYWWAPWEVEARGYEEALLFSWEHGKTKPNKMLKERKFKPIRELHVHGDGQQSIRDV